MVASSSESVNSEFEKIGAVIVRGVLSEQEVRELRQTLDEKFEAIEAAREGSRFLKLPPSQCFNTEQLTNAILKPRIIETLQQILEPGYRMLPDLEVHRNQFGLHRKRGVKQLFGLAGAGWHCDSGAEGLPDYFLDPNYRFVKCGLYLQKNTLELGGGIEIVPGAHKTPVRTGISRLDHFLRKVRQQIMTIFKAKFVDLNAGDFVAFHSCLPHRGTIPTAFIPDGEISKDEIQIPAEHTKYVIYHNAARADFSDAYMKHSLQRAKTEISSPENASQINKFYSDYVALKFPESYPKAVVDKVNDRGFQIAKMNEADYPEAIEVSKASETIPFRNTIFPNT